MGEVKILQVPRGMNGHADVRSKMASKETHNFGSVYTEILLHHSIDEMQVLEIPAGPNWMDPIVRYLKNGILLEDKLEAQRLIAKAAHCVLHGSKLYKRSYTWPYLRCLVPFESEYALREVHEGICGDHGGRRTLAQKIIRHGYFWPTILRDALEFVKKCGPCQRFATTPRLPAIPYTSVAGLLPFTMWGMDLLGPFPKAPGGHTLLYVAIDYFTKWVEVKAVARPNSKATKFFFYHDVVCRFGIPKCL
ncbi:uncharacterized protein LOC143850630 [Tasmannia lanceolata]|uniref:uncharacterized protein LOC143850630 n=1 Tax=Tasmannia lanceolata TaxID=3420 RepID=UPI00406409F5